MGLGVGAGTAASGGNWRHSSSKPRTLPKGVSPERRFPAHETRTSAVGRASFPPPHPGAEAHGAAGAPRPGPTLPQVPEVPDHSWKRTLKAEGPGRYDYRPGPSYACGFSACLAEPAVELGIPLLEHLWRVFVGIKHGVTFKINFTRDVLENRPALALTVIEGLRAL